MHCLYILAHLSRSTTRQLDHFCDIFFMNMVSMVKRKEGVRGQSLTKNHLICSMKACFDFVLRKVWNRARVLDAYFWRLEVRCYRNLDLLSVVCDQPCYLIWWKISNTSHSMMRCCEIMGQLTFTLQPTESRRCAPPSGEVLYILYSSYPIRCYTLRYGVPKIVAHEKWIVPWTNKYWWW